MLELPKEMSRLILIQHTPLVLTKMFSLSQELPTFTIIKLDNSLDKFGLEMPHLLISELKMQLNTGVINWTSYSLTFLSQLMEFGLTLTRQLTCCAMEFAILTKQLTSQSNGTFHIFQLEET
jgi:hypothetical protein